MYGLKKWEGIFTSKFVGTEPSSYEKRIYRAAFLRRLRNTVLGEPTMSKLAHTSRCQRPTLVVSMKTSFIGLFFVLG